MEVHLNMRVLLRFVGWSLENGELTLIEGWLLDGLGIELDSLSNPSIMEDSHSDGAQPGVVIIRCIRNKESIDLKVVVAQQVEGGAVVTGRCSRAALLPTNGWQSVGQSHTCT